MLPTDGAFPAGIYFFDHLQSWHLFDLPDAIGTKQEGLLFCPIAIFLLLHQTVPERGLCPSGDLSSPYLQYLHVYATHLLKHIIINNGTIDRVYKE
jgi:hypothetical protein